METTKTPVTLYYESNPNPNSLKFVANFMLLEPNELHDFTNMEAAKDSPLAQELFTYPFVKEVFFMSNFVTITKDEETNWEEVKPSLKAHIQDYLETGKRVVSESTQPKEVINTSNSELDEKIISILDEYIKPAVESDGGAISFDSFENGTVKVILQGSCSGCPSSTITLKAGIENLLKSMLPEVKQVEAVER